jgi:hypothetical protein
LFRIAFDNSSTDLLQRLVNVRRLRHAGRHVLRLGAIGALRCFVDHPREPGHDARELVERQRLAGERVTDGGDIEREVERQSLLAIAHLLKTAAFGGAQIETVGLPFPRQPRHALRGGGPRHAEQDRGLDGVGERQRGGDAVSQPPGDRARVAAIVGNRQGDQLLDQCLGLRNAERADPRHARQDRERALKLRLGHEAAPAVER